MCSEAVIRVRNLAKCYHLYDHPLDRLKQFLWRGRRRFYREFWALQALSFELPPGSVLGVVGRNGSGKSTLLQLLAGTLTPTAGDLTVRGRVAALLELGSGFNPEFTGRENVFMSAAIMGLGEEDTAARFDAIVDFAGIRDFIDQPVKTYSSGMYIRLAFAVATSVDPDILVIDEALSVGDGAFARKSFNRIMALKDAGKTILFCSHSLYQVELLCNRVLWLDRGEVRALGAPKEVTAAYGAFLDGLAGTESPASPAAPSPEATGAAAARITGVRVLVDGRLDAAARSGRSTVEVEVSFEAADGERPSVAVGFLAEDGRWVASCGTHNDGLGDLPAPGGRGRVTAVFERFPLLRGEYRVSVWLLCEKGLFAHEVLTEAGRVKVAHEGLEKGLVHLEHTWKTAPPA
jgi:lipopolysaccharide transport system ATP-binding protein